MGRYLIIAYSNYVRDGRLKRHARVLAERGDWVDVICLSEAATASSGHDRIRLVSTGIQRYRGASRLNYVWSYARFFLKATALGLRLSFVRPYDAVIVCSMPDAAVMCALALRLFKSRVVLDMKDTMPELYCEKFGKAKDSLFARLLMFEERASAYLADRVLAVHELHRQRLVRAGIPPHKIRVVINAPDPRLFAPKWRKRKAGERFELVCHGTVAKRLGLDTALEALALLRERIPALRLTVIGSGDYLPQAKGKAGALGLGEQVRFVAPVPLEALVAYLDEADVGLVPNLPGPATHLMLPVKMLEYAALGIPIIAARLETIEHYFGQHAARLFEPGNPAALAQAIVELYENPALGQELARKAAQVVAELSWEKQARAYLETIDELSLPLGAQAYA